MRISNETYDGIKWVALNLIPALEVLILTVGKIWELPYYTEIGATIAAIGVFLAAIIGVSRKTYLEELAEPTDDDILALFEEEDEEEGGETDDSIIG